jgi:hypothetical protein
MPVPVLPPRDWLPDVHAGLLALIERYGRDAPGYDASAPPFAVFDWDQTITRFDIGDAVLAYQVERMAFALDHPPFWELLPQPLPEGSRAAAQALVATANSFGRLGTRFSSDHRQRARMHSAPDAFSAGSGGAGSPDPDLHSAAEWRSERRA